MINLYTILEAKESLDDQFADFLSFLFANLSSSNSQIFQDLFVIYWLNGKRNGRFLEFGASNGIQHSNTWLLEKTYGWSGVLSEPSEAHYPELEDNRPNQQIIKDCISHSTGLSVDFFVATDFPELSTVKDFQYAEEGFSDHTVSNRNNSGYITQVNSISLNDVFLKFFNDKPIDYMSVDTEGSELTILKNFNFSKYGPAVVTVEHNHTPAEFELNKLFEENGYTRVLSSHTAFDAWFVRNDTFKGK